MSRSLRIFRGAAIVLVLVIVLAIVWWRTASIRVDPSTLDYLHAYRAPHGLTLIGAWEPPGGLVLDRAEFRGTGAGCIVTLYSRPIANLRGETSRLFRVEVPLAAAPQSIVIDGRRGNAPLAVGDPPAHADAVTRVEIEAVRTDG